MKDLKRLIKEKEYAKIKKILSNMQEADIAEIFEELDNDSLIKVFRLLSKDNAAEVFSFLEIEKQQIIINSLSTKEAASIIDNMYADDAADLIDEMPANVVKKLLAKTTDETRRDINFLLKYPDDSAGSLMTVEFIEIKDNNRVKDAINTVRSQAKNTEHIHILYVVDHRRKLVGSVSLHDLLINDENLLVTDIMDKAEHFITTLTDQEEVANDFKKYDVTSLPVVDLENRLVGIITVDDIMDIVEEETTEDIEKMAAITPNDKPYMKTGVFETWKKRIPWLLILMISAAFTGKIIQSYENALASYVILTSFIPMFMDTGGNAGGQASVTIIRALSLHEIDFKDIFKIMWKEMRVAILVGITLAIANFFKLMIFDQVTVPIALVVCLTLIVTIFFAKLVGCTLPLFAKKMGFDPAVMASPFITTIVDALSLIIYFQIATHLLNI